ncbi:MAG TPA: hypothetical protein VGM06_20590 [Polyangiaceae bacterium]|jgi:hypothetical protein
MNAVAFVPLTLAGFEAIPVVTAGALELSLNGNADMTVSAGLKGYLKDFDNEAQRSGVRVVHVRLGELYFLSSSCLQALAGWLLLVASRSADTRYQVSFRTHAARDWQRRSLEAIRRVAPKIVEVL